MMKMTPTMTQLIWAASPTVRAMAFRRFNAGVFKAPGARCESFKRVAD
jgi:hypothetical protein